MHPAAKGRARLEESCTELYALVSRSLACGLSEDFLGLTSNLCKMVRREHGHRHRLCSPP